MRIPQTPGGDRTDDSPLSPQYVMPESEIIAFVKGLRIQNASTVTLRLATIAIIIVQMMQSRLDGKSNKANLLLVKQIVQSYKNKRYLNFTDPIVATLEPDKERFDSALASIARALELLHGSSLLYSAAREFYEELMNEIKEQEGEQ